MHIFGPSKDKPTRYSVGHISTIKCIQNPTIPEGFSVNTNVAQAPKAVPNYPWKK